MGVVERGKRGRKKREPKLNTFVSALTYHKSYENRGLIVFTLQVHPSPPLSLHHHPTPPPCSTPPPHPRPQQQQHPTTTSLTQLPADTSYVCSPSAGANPLAPTDSWDLPHLTFLLPDIPITPTASPARSTLQLLSSPPAPLLQLSSTVAHSDTTGMQRHSALSHRDTEADCCSDEPLVVHKNFEKTKTHVICILFA